MPRLPDVNDLGSSRPVVQQQGIVRINGQQIGQAVESTGERMANLGFQIQEREDRMNLAKARAKFTQDQINFESQFDQDQDYKTYGQRYQAGINKVKSDASSMISNRKMREAFDLEADVEITRGYDRLAQKAWAKERDSGVASMNEVLTLGRENALRAGDDQTAMNSLRMMNETISAAKDNGYISATQAQQLQQKTAVDYATAKAGMLPPDARIKFLNKKGSFADLIPADVRAEMLDRSKKEQRAEYLKSVGPAEAEKLSSKYATLGEAMAANNASDPEVRSRIDSELRRTYAIREDARLAARKQTFSTIEENLIANKGDISALDTKLFSSLDGADYLRIKTFADKVAEGGFIANDWKLINKLTDMAKNDPASFAKEDLTQYIDKMDGTYRKKFETAQEKAKENESDPEISQLYSMGAQIGKTLDILLPKPGKSESQSTKTAYNVKRGEFERILRDKVNDFEVQSGRKANEAERQQIIDDFTRDVVSKKEHWFWPDTEEKVNITSVPPEYVREISAKLAASGRAVTPENIIATYEIRKKAGLIK